MINIWQVYHIIWHRYSILCCFHLFPQQRCALGSPCGVAWARGFGQTPSPKPPKTWFLTPKSWSKGFPNLVSKTWFSRPETPQTRFPDPQPARSLIETYWNRVSQNTVFREPAPAAPWNFQYLRSRPEPSARGSSWTPKRFPPKAPTWAGERNPLEGNGFGWGRKDVIQAFEMT